MSGFFCSACGVVDVVDGDVCDHCGRDICSFARLEELLGDQGFEVVDALRLRHLTDRMERSSESIRRGVEVLGEVLDASEDAERDAVTEYPPAKLRGRSERLPGPKLGRVGDRWSISHRILTDEAASVRRLVRSQRAARAWLGRMQRSRGRRLAGRVLVSVSLPNLGRVIGP